MFHHLVPRKNITISLLRPKDITDSHIKVKLLQLLILIVSDNVKYEALHDIPN